MGRGKSKARQTKVARELKYATQDMDIEELAKELHSKAEKSKDEPDSISVPKNNFLNND